MRFLFFTLLVSLSVYSKERIVTTAPSLCHMVEYLGGADQIVGHDNLCKLNDKKKRKIIGSGISPSIEKIMLLRPSIVLVLKSKTGELRGKLEQLNIKSITIDHDSLDGLLSSITKIGGLIGRYRHSLNIRNDLTDRLNLIKKNNKLKKDVLFIIDRIYKREKFHSFYLAGKKTIFHDLLQVVGINNAVIKSGYPLCSLECLINYKNVQIYDVYRENLPNQAYKVKSLWDRYKNFINQENIKILIQPDLFIPSVKMVESFIKIFGV